MRLIEARRAIKSLFFKSAVGRIIRPGGTDLGCCTACGNSGRFYKKGENLRETFICDICGSNSRNRHLALVLFDALGLAGPCSVKKIVREFPRLKVYEAQSDGAVNRLLGRLPGYISSEFFADVPPGSISKSGVLCQDLQKLTFKDGSFDLVISQDVLEHVRVPELAWREIYRVLTPSGFHIFTIPFHRDKKTVRRVGLDGDKDTFILPKIFHGDGVRDGLVYTDFGNDLIDHLKGLGFSTTVFWSNELSAEDAERYRIYWNCVFVSRKE